MKTREYINKKAKTADRRRVNTANNRRGVQIWSEKGVRVAFSSWRWRWRWTDRLTKNHKDGGTTRARSGTCLVSPQRPSSIRDTMAIYSGRGPRRKGNFLNTLRLFEICGKSWRCRPARPPPTKNHRKLTDAASGPGSGSEAALPASSPTNRLAADKPSWAVRVAVRVPMHIAYTLCGPLNGQHWVSFRLSEWSLQVEMSGNQCCA